MLLVEMEKMDLDNFYREIDIADETVLARAFGIRSVPTIIVIDETGKSLANFEGPLTKKTISAFLGLLKKLVKQ